MDYLKQTLLEEGTCLGVRDQLDCNHTHGEEVFKEYRKRVGLGVSTGTEKRKKKKKKEKERKEREIVRKMSGLKEEQGGK